MKHTKKVLFTSRSWLVLMLLGEIFSSCTHDSLSVTDNSSTTNKSNWPTVVRPTITSTKAFNIKDYGALSSSKDNTKQIQAALDGCANNGGGKVVVPADTFLCGPIVMGSNTNLYLSKGAVLEILPYGQGNGIDANSYPNTGTQNVYDNFISCKSNASNLMISGTGTIYGNGAAWWKAFDSLTAAGVSMKRGCLIRFMNCKYIEIDSITLKDAPGSHITIGMHGNASNATIKNITINTKVPSHNTDGIDTWGPNINIEDCYISDGDDNVAIDQGSQYISIKRCTFGYGHGTSVGSYTTGICHVLVDSCSYTGTDNGIRLKSDVDRGSGEHDFTFSNLTMKDVKNPVYIDSYYTGKPSTPQQAEANKTAVTSTTPEFRDVLIKNVTSTGTTKNNSLYIYGRPEQHVKHLVFDNVNILASKGMIIDFADSVIFKNNCNIKATSGNDTIQIYKSTLFYY
jgi:polygalacturonase